MQITVNGESVKVENIRLDSVLLELGYNCKRVVVAINDTFVPRVEWSQRELLRSDRVEVLSAIEGG